MIKRRRRAVLVDIKIVEKPELKPLLISSLPKRFLPQIRIRATAPPQSPEATVLRRPTDGIEDPITSPIVGVPKPSLRINRLRLFATTSGSTHVRNDIRIDVIVGRFVVVSPGEDAAENGEQDEEDIEQVPALLHCNGTEYVGGKCKKRRKSEQEEKEGYDRQEDDQNRRGENRRR